MSLLTELEVLTGKLIRGDMTPIVYELIKDSAFVKDIVTYSTREDEKEDDSTNRDTYTPNNHSGSGLVYENWFSESVQSLPYQGESKHGI